MGYSGGVMRTLSQQIKAARQRQHLSQSELALRVGCRQSALSMYERGRATALAAGTVGRICEVLGILPPNAAELEAAAEGKLAAEKVRVYCPNHECPSNLPLVVDGRTVLLPKSRLVVADERHCPWCGELVERCCPDCGAPLNEGAFCTRCGGAYLGEVDDRVPGPSAEVRRYAMQW